MGDAVIALVVGIVLGPFLAVIAYALVAGAEAAEDIPTLVLLAVQVATSFAVLLFLSRRRGSGSWRTDYGFVLEARHVWGIAAGMALQIGVAVLSLPLVERFGEDGPQQRIAQEATELSGGELLLFALLVAVLTPIFEEIVFRGMLLSRLVRSLNRHWAAVISAAAFAAIHLADPNALLVVPGLFVVGLVLAYLAYYSGNLSLPIFVHMGVNGLAVLILSFADELNEIAETVESVIRVNL